MRIADVPSMLMPNDHPFHSLANLAPVGAALLCLLLGACSTGRHTADIRRPPVPPPPTNNWVEVGRSVKGNPIEALTIGHGRLRVLLVGSIHGNETEGLAVLNDILSELRDPDIRSRATFYVIRDVNPDGTASGSRHNSRGVDLNRNYPASNFEPSARYGVAPLSEPEAATLHAQINHFAPDVVVVFHSTAKGPFVNHDGPQPRTSALATVFAAAARSADARWRVVDHMGYETPGSLGSYVGLDRRIPILTIEFQRGQSPESVRPAAIAGLRTIVGADASGSMLAK